MSALRQIGGVLGSPLGGFVYHLVVLLALEAALGMAWGEWQHARREQTRRLLWAMVGLILVRFSYALAAVIVPTGRVDWVSVFPPLERFVDATSICLLGWAFVPPGKRGAKALHVAFAASLVLGVIALVGSMIAWGIRRIGGPPLDYNSTGQAVAWSIWQLVLISLTALAVVRNRSEGTGAFLGAMLVLAVGRLWQLAYPAEVPNLPAWERLANLVAYPLVAAAVYQTISTGLRDDARQLQDISRASLDQVKSLLVLLDACQRISSSLSLPTVLDNAAEGIARVLDADECAIALPEKGNPRTMRLAAIYGLTGQKRGETPTFPLENQLAVQKAMRRRECVVVVDSNLQLQGLFDLLGSRDAGPLLVQPLLLDGEAIGTILIGNSRSRRPFTPNDVRLCQSLADRVVEAIRNARRFEAAQERNQELQRSLDEIRQLPHPSIAQVGELDVGAGAERGVSRASADSL